MEGKQKFVVKCPLCNYSGCAYTTEGAELVLRAHSWKKHPVEHTRAKELEDKEIEDSMEESKN